MRGGIGHEGLNPVGQPTAARPTPLTDGVRYQTYWGREEPLKLLPDGADILFVGAYTQPGAR